MTASTDKAPKAKGPIRWEAIIPFCAVTGLVWAYFFFFFDGHLRRALEFGGYHAVGAEVNIKSLETSFWKASLRIQGIELTDPEAPTTNMLEIDDIRFSMLWDALLRAKVVINEMATEGIRSGSPRQRPGRVKPPEPPKKGPGFIEREAAQLTSKLIEDTQENYSDNILGDLAAILGGTDAQDQLGKIEGTLVSKEKMKEVETAFKEKSKAWESKFKSLPGAKDFQALGDRLGKVKSKDFKSPQELADSIKQAEEIIKEADAKFKEIQAAGQQFGSDKNSLEQGLKDLDQMIKKDLKDLESRFKIPSLDAKAIALNLFRPYITPYLGQINKYRRMADQYLPPKFKNKKTGEPDDVIQPRPRAKGFTYEFGRPNAYPTVWVKKVSISSEAGTGQDRWNLSGQVLDITTNQKIIGKPTTAALRGDFPAQRLSGFAADLSFDNRPADSEIKFNIALGSYPVENKSIIQSPDVSLAFAKADAETTVEGQLIGLRRLNLDIDNKLKGSQFELKAKDPQAQDFLKGIFDGIPNVTLFANIKGDLPHFSLFLKSNVGDEIARGFQVQVQKKIDEARKKIEAYVNEAIGKEKAKLEAEIAKFKSQIEGEIKKLEAQANSQKQLAEAKINESKKRAEEQAQAQVNEAKRAAEKALQKEGQKAVDDLKKKLGF